MPDRAEKLRLTLAELEAELRDIDSLDDDTRSLLSEAAKEISGVLVRGTQQTTAHHTLSARLIGSVETFETAHPTLAGIVQRLVDGLGQMGI